MRSTLTHEEIVELLPDYALGSLNDDETVTVAEHLAGCPVCRAELQFWQTTVDQLALAAPSAFAPDNLHQRLLKRIAPEHPRPAPAQSGWLAWLRRSAPVWGAVALLLVVVWLLASNLSMRQQLAQHQQQTAPQTAIPMFGQQPTDAASGVVMVNPNGHYGTLMVQHLPQLPPAQVYQLWLIQNEQRTDGGTFNVDGYGCTSLEIEPPQDLALYDAFGITIEPVGGSPGPTGPKVLGSQ